MSSMADEMYEPCINVAFDTSTKNTTAVGVFENSITWEIIHKSIHLKSLRC